MTRGTAGTGVVVAAVTGALAVTAVGVATADESVHAAKVTRSLKADPSGALKYTKTKLHAPAGKITIKMKNPVGTHSKHGIEVEGHGVEKRGKNVRPGKTSTVTVRLKPGKYDYYCPVDGHHAAGMEGKLIVR